MSLLLLSTSALVFALKVSAMPNPHPAITARAVASPVNSADSADITSFSYSTLPSSVYDQLISEWGSYSVPSSVLAAEDAEYSSWTAEFYKTVSPAELSSIEAYNAEESALYASWTASAYASLSPAQSSELFAEYASWTASVGREASASAKAEAASAPAAAKISQPATPNPAITNNAQVAAATLGPLPQSQNPSLHGITCVSQSGVQGSSTLNSSACAASAQNACRKLNESKTGAYFWDQWVWSGANSGDPSDFSQNCALAYWLPKSVVRDPGTVNTMVPDEDRCASDVFTRMFDVCGGRTNAASVNVAVLPDGKGSTGQQVDAGQVSYLLAPKPWPCDYGCSN